MYHERFRGAHYEIGYRYGASLLKHGQRLLEHVPFPVTQERRNFAQACIPVYQELFPEILVFLCCLVLVYGVSFFAFLRWVCFLLMLLLFWLSLSKSF